MCSILCTLIICLISIILLTVFLVRSELPIKWLNNVTMYILKTIVIYFMDHNCSQKYLM